MLARERNQVMTKKLLMEIARRNGGYCTPELNEKLYLHNQNFTGIAELEEFTQLKVLWLQSNQLTSAFGLSHLAHLRVLYLHSNRINSLDSFKGLATLETLNLSVNIVSSLKGLSEMPILANLYISKNLLTTAEDVAELKLCPKLNVLDISDNKLKDAATLEILSALPELAVLYSSNNPMREAIPHFRKTAVATLLSLSCLDGFPVESLDRRCAVAFLAGGREAELQVRAQHRQELRDRTIRDRAALRRTLAEGRMKRLAREGRLPDHAEPFKHLLRRAVVDAAQEEALRAQGAECSVCQQAFVQGSEMCELPCAHSYHMHCIVRWIAQSGSCPVCRRPLEPAESAPGDDAANENENEPHGMGRREASGAWVERWPEGNQARQPGREAGRQPGSEGRGEDRGQGSAEAPDGASEAQADTGVGSDIKSEAQEGMEQKFGDAGDCRGIHGLAHGQGSGEATEEEERQFPRLGNTIQQGSEVRVATTADTTQGVTAAEHRNEVERAAAAPEALHLGAAHGAARHSTRGGTALSQDRGAALCVRAVRRWLFDFKRAGEELGLSAEETRAEYAAHASRHGWPGG